MSRRTDALDLHSLALRSGEGRRFSFHVTPGSFAFGGETYAVQPDAVPVGLDVSRTTGGGWALRLRFEAALEGPCMRCLRPARPRYAVDAREFEQPGGGDELSSPYVEDGSLDVAQWARDALALALDPQITCRRDCPGLCPQCGADLLGNPGHSHAKAPDPRWAKLSELKFDQG